MPPALPPQLQVRPIPPFHATVRIPGSKSLTNRALLLAALAQGQSTLTNVLFADDTRVMMAALQALGVDLEIDQAGTTVAVTGRGGAFPARQSDLFLGNAGTATRFLTAALAASPGAVARIDGVPRMRERPIGELVGMLRHFGLDVGYELNEGYPPLRVNGKAARGGDITLKPTLSSQFISALIQIGPLFWNGLHIAFDGPVTSAPYVRMTCSLMQRFGASVALDPAFTAVRVQPSPDGYTGCDYAIEPDASNATYFRAAAAATGSTIDIPALGPDSPQGDTRFAAVLDQMRTADGQLRGIDADLNDIPDAAMTIAALAVLARGPTTIRNVGNWRVKETDRMQAMRVELSKLGASVHVAGDDITITPPASGRITPAAIDTYDDHRMAMSFAVVGLAQPGVTINDPACVNKTFPTFWATLNTLGPAVELPAGTPEPAA